MNEKFSSSEDDIMTLMRSCRFSPCIFLDTVLQDGDNNTSYVFSDLTDILVFNDNDDPHLFFEKMRGYLKKGYWVCGYFSYEFGYFLEPALRPLRRNSLNPLVWLAVCRSPHIFPRSRDMKRVTCVNTGDSDFSCMIRNFCPNIGRREYDRQLLKIKRYLEEGLTYQVNFTFKMKFDFQGDPFSLYLGLRRTQPTSYTAFINTGEQKIISVSPELFFRMDNGKIKSKPMKGTAARGVTAAEDRKNNEWLRTNEKIRAENVMITDLLRNDIGRIACNVRVPRLFEVERYRTLYQMTSTIEADIGKNVSWEEIFSSLFPCGSVTGAPKIETMKLIGTLEKEQRGIYTGSIGYISPDNKACFNVAIRTVVLEGVHGELGTGGGIVYDSLDSYEYEEALLKTRFLTDAVYFNETDRVFA